MFRKHEVPPAIAEEIAVVEAEGPVDPGLPADLSDDVQGEPAPTTEDTPPATKRKTAAKRSK